MLEIANLSATLRGAGVPAKKAWWEQYLKHRIEFYGVPMAEIRAAVRAWAEPVGEPELRRAAALQLLEQPIAEEKLAGILVLQELLLPFGGLDGARDLPLIAQRFDSGSIADWNTTDWLCVRVLGPLIELEGRPTAEQIAGWVDAPSLWRRRSAAVAFVPLAGRPPTDLGFEVGDLVLGVCTTLAPDPERFIQTGIGWVLRDLSDVDADAVYTFLSDHHTVLSREAIRMAAARLSDEHRADLGIRGRRRRR
jgi:3-methyladenine DNA glycosylase AlkD